ncbi:MAG: hypothetical protein C3L26_13095 [Candidatus Sedimenticola endophacoides]|nr:MAG: hypothetical protein C3L26_13095 [Candidatus Sedimenticola endophacoides]
MGRRFAASYRRIGEMVPQWSDALDLESLQRLESAMAAGDAGEVPRLLRKLSHSCDSCHREYRAVTVALYRTPDFSALRVDDGAGGTLTYPEAMERLSVLVNRVRIASDDGRAQAAREALHALDGGLDALAGSCGACHRDAVPADRVFADRSRQFAVLGAALETADREAAGRALGDIAVKVCALCHGVHRTLHDLKARLAR